MSRRVAIPADFAAEAWRANLELAERYGVSASTVRSWRREKGLPDKRKRKAKPAAKPERKGGAERYAVPEDFAANAHRRNPELMVRYGVSMTIIVRWRKETGIPGEKGRGPQKSRPGSTDSDAEIRTCLNCPANYCSGDCLRRKAARI